MKKINILYHKNINIEVLTSKIIITITVKIINIIKQTWEKKWIKKHVRTKTKIIIINILNINIIIALITWKNEIKSKAEKKPKNINKRANKKKW